MTVFHLDGNCVYTLDGAPAPDAFERAERFALGGWLTGRAPATVVVNPVSPEANGLRVTDFCNGHMLLSLDLEPLPLPHSKPLQCECSGAKRHLITVRGFENAPLVAKTDGACHAVLCPVAATRVTASCARVDGGDLIRIFAHGEKTFCAVLFCRETYLPLLSLVADEIVFDDGTIAATDRVRGMSDCSIVRRLAFKDGKFCELSRSFEYHCRHRYPDGLIGRLYLEKLFYRDPERSALISPRCAVDVDGTIGDFARVFDDDFCGCKRGIFIVADDEKYCRVRRVAFAVKDGLIEDVKVV